MSGQERVAERPLHLIERGRFQAFLESCGEAGRRFLAGLLAGRTPRSGEVLVYPDEDGAPAAVAAFDRPPGLWELAALWAALPPLRWRPSIAPGLVDPERLALAFRLAAYRYRNGGRQPSGGPELALDCSRRTACVAEAVAFARDLVNAPANRLGPAELEDACRRMAAEFGASVRVVTDRALLEEGFPAVFAVGRASPRRPRLIELRWERGGPAVALVGKGVCFDTGGLDIKPRSAMALMKKDMGGAAVAMALARAVMAMKWPVRLRLLVPAVDNAIAGDAFRPGDVVSTRKGLEVEIGDTDAEGRLVLADALAAADEERPDLIIDLAPLTRAARVALGAELPALFTPDDALAEELLMLGRREEEPLWRLPLFDPYGRFLESRIADLNNVSQRPTAGAITAALFLARFVEHTRSWLHLDIYAWNDEDRPGRPQGGEATALRPLFALIERRIQSGDAP